MRVPQEETAQSAFVVQVAGQGVSRQAPWRHWVRLPQPLTWHWALLWQVWGQTVLRSVQTLPTHPVLVPQGVIAHSLED